MGHEALALGGHAEVLADGAGLGVLLRGGPGEIDRGRADGVGLGGTGPGGAGGGRHEAILAHPAAVPDTRRSTDP